MPVFPPTLHSRVLRQIIHGGLADKSGKAWQRLAQDLAQEQQRHNPVFRRWLQGVSHTRVRCVDFPGLPIQAFKESIVSSLPVSRRKIRFESSGTTSNGRKIVSRHFFRDLELYRASVIAGWRIQIQNASTKPLNFSAILPSFQENPRSSLSCMVEILMREFGDGHGFWAMKHDSWDWTGLARHLNRLGRDRQPVTIFGTAFGWVHFLDWCATRRQRFRLIPGSMVLETGGYKGRSRELATAALHRKLAHLTRLPIQAIRSEYSMCELSSQAWSFRKSGRILFRFPPWCRARVVQPGNGRLCAHGERGVLEILDLANVDSCAFLRTEDLAADRGTGFELLGRLPRAGLRGCSLAFE